MTRAETGTCQYCGRTALQLVRVTHGSSVRHDGLPSWKLPPHRTPRNFNGGPCDGSGKRWAVVR